MDITIILIIKNFMKTKKFKEFINMEVGLDLVNND